VRLVGGFRMSNNIEAVEADWFPAGVALRGEPNLTPLFRPGKRLADEHLVDGSR